MDIYKVGTAQYIQTIVQDTDGVPVHGATVVVQIYNNSNNKYLDSISHTFVPSGGNKNNPMAELGTTGVYRFLFNQAIDGSTEQIYTTIFSVSTPYIATAFDTISFTDQDLSSIKGAGWDAAVHKPTLMNIANKDGYAAFNPILSSLEAVSLMGGGGSGGGGENYNTAGV